MLKYSYPMHPIDEKIKPCTIGGYYFTWLHSMNDYMAVGTKLDNCLISWERRNNPVIAVYRCGNPVAAIEVESRLRWVVQARVAGNACIDMNSELGKAFKQWTDKYSISIEFPDTADDIIFWPQNII